MGVANRNNYSRVSATLVILLALIPSFLQAQDNSKVFIQGVVVGADSLAPLPYVHIRGQGGLAGTATDAEGNFAVNVLKRDTIMFTSVGYKPYFLVPADSTEASLQKLVIKMVPEVGQLREITIRAYDNIEQYIRRVPEPFSLERKKGEPLFERTDPKEVPAVSMSGARLEGAITAFANLFNSRYQQEKKLKEIMEIKEAEMQQEQLRNIMTIKFQEMLAFAADLSETDIQRFTLSHMPDPVVMAYMDDYTIMLGIVQNLKNFETEEERQVAVKKLLKTKVFEGDQSTIPQ